MCHWPTDLGHKALNLSWASTEIIFFRLCREQIDSSIIQQIKHLHSWEFSCCLHSNLEWRHKIYYLRNKFLKIVMWPLPSNPPKEVVLSDFIAHIHKDMHWKRYVTISVIWNKVWIIFDYYEMYWYNLDFYPTGLLIIETTKDNSTVCFWNTFS